MYSASKFNCYDDCKKKYWYKYVKKVKVKFQELIFFEKGKYIHKLLEHYPNLPPTKYKFKLSHSRDIKQYDKIVTDLSSLTKNILKLPSMREIKFNIYDGYQSEGKKKKFTGFIDFVGRNADNKPMIIDWKTGKVYPNKSDDQLKIYALWLFLKNKNINSIACSYAYVEHNEYTTYIYYREDLENIKKYFDDKINKIESETDYKKNISRNCDYCDFFNLCKPYITPVCVTVIERD